MKINIRNVVMVTGAALGLLLIGAALGRGCGDRVSEEERNRILLEGLAAHREEHPDVVTVLNEQVNDLQEIIDWKDEEIGIQADLILKLKDKPTEVKYVVKTVTVFQPVDNPVTVAVKDLPPEKLFGLPTKDGGRIVTDRMESRDTDGDGIPDEVTFTPYKQTVVLDAVLGETSSSLLLRMKSSYDDKFHDIPLEAKVTRIGSAAPERKLIDPMISMQVGAFAGAGVVTGAPLAGYAAGLGMPWLHPTPSLEILSPSVTLGTSWYPANGSTNLVVRGGATVLSYNVGGHGGSLLRDTWVGVDVGLGSDLGLSGGVVLATHL